ncbi:DUF262 domain-containing protein [Flavobacterium sharifuzzamanii]|uniref:DUF262 domain-containing protein n=1 Tax=Flavobacterium sharifuzzamanii TaxID=2211133 RepID=UPI000DACE118|nr:DUF262 domain-containing protein [Flavobacterium sharifuzzamanii]KAF2082097.1 DUF262 domain-containing protein [Flavobacterium sharifuzzamanii]
MIGFKTIGEVIKTEDEITANSFSLEKLLYHPVTIHLQIPLYQRLYVWEIEEIKLFVEDIIEAFFEQEESYYIGNMMFANTANDNNITIDLIDGQQRFTTLWLISILLSKYNENLRNFAFINGTPRLSFTSRENVNDYFASLSSKTIDILLNENIDLKNSDDSIEPIVTGIINIYNTIRNGKGKYGWNTALINKFGDYIFQNLLMVQTTVPSKNNLNQIFESLNSGGKQLENHQILKSRFLKVLRGYKYSQEQIDQLVYKWEVCSDMNLYIERSVYSIVSQKWEDVINPLIFNSDFDSNKANDYFSLNNYIDTFRKPIDLLKILKDEPDASVTKKNKENKSAKSIISFSQFLLHTLRVYNLIHKGDAISIDSKNLLLYFNIESGIFSFPENVEKFINLLFDLRFLFDKFVIKWTLEDEENQESLLVNKYYFNKVHSNKGKYTYSVKREFVESNRQLSLAQSVLHIVQESKTQYWITPFLHYLYNRYFQNSIQETYANSIISAVSFIENLDNYFYNQQNEDQNMSELSFAALSKTETKSHGDFKFVSHKLTALKGVFFFRYWFYKTEYLIWKYRNDFKEMIQDAEFDVWNKYKITFKTSIEHIFPQSKNGFEEEADRALYPQVTDPILKDYFGNLVLLTVSENSQYGALDVNEKKIMHNLKLDKNSINSLKSSLIFKLVDFEDEEKGWKKGDWNFNKAKYHLEEHLMPLYKKHLES